MDVISNFERGPLLPRPYPKMELITSPKKLYSDLAEYTFLDGIVKLIFNKKLLVMSYI